MLAPPWASLPNEKSVLAHVSLNTPTVYPKDSSRSSLYLSGYRLHMYGPAQYIFFASTLYLFGDHISPCSPLYWEQREERAGVYFEGAIMSILKIALLGPPEVEHGDYWLTFPDRKALALLAYLAAEGGLHGRQKLTRMLCPESGMAHGRTAMRITLLHLQHILEGNALPECEAHLLITHDALGLELASGIDLDLHALEAAWKLMRVLPTPVTPRFVASRFVAPRFIEGVKGEVSRTLIARLQSAAVLYRGGFLQDFTLRNTLDFDNWVGMQQGYWYQRIEQVFDYLSQLQSAEGSLEQAIETVERWRSFDPLNEGISLRLMQLQFASGNRTAALKTYETYQDVLMTELSARPSRKLVALAEALRNASPPRFAHSGAGRCAPTARPLLNAPFVGSGAAVS